MKQKPGRGWERVGVLEAPNNRHSKRIPTKKRDIVSDPR